MVPGQYIGNNTTLYTRTTTTPYVQSTAPAQIVAGGALTVSGNGAGSVINADSALIAGGALSITAGALNNQSATGTQTVTLTGQTAYPIIDQCAWYQSCSSYIAGYFYQPYSTSSSTAIPLNTVTVIANSNTVTPLTSPSSSVSAPASNSTALLPNTPSVQSYRSGSGQISQTNVVTVNVASPGAPSVQSSTPALNQASPATAITVNEVSSITPSVLIDTHSVSQKAQNDVSGITLASASQLLAHAPPTVQQVTVPGSSTQASLVISTLSPSLVAPANKLFTILPAPNANYLVETDPAFTNQQNFLSSNYFLQKLNINPAYELKRYGDGFYEQQLINQQVMGLTGKEYLGDYSSTQSEYQALMDAGVTYAKDFDLTPGVTLSAAEMAKMTTDMVWMTTKTVTLAQAPAA